MIHDTDYDRGDWEHEVKRDKALDRIAELEAENSLLTDALANYEQENARLEKDNDDIHELAEHYRVENGRLREALHKYGGHTYDEYDIPCYGGQFTRCVDENGNAETYECTCGYSAALERKQ